MTAKATSMENDVVEGFADVVTLLWNALFEVDPGWTYDLCAHREILI